MTAVEAVLGGIQMQGVSSIETAKHHLLRTVGTLRVEMHRRNIEIPDKLWEEVQLPIMIPSLREGEPE